MIFATESTEGLQLIDADEASRAPHWLDVITDPQPSRPCTRTLTRDGNKVRVVWVPRVYSREDYKAALDAMLLAQSTRREYDDITAAASRASRPGPFYPEGCWYFDLRDFTWCTSGVMAAQAPSENPPTPEDFAQYILALFIAQNGDIPARE